MLAIAMPRNNSIPVLSVRQARAAVVKFLKDDTGQDFAEYALILGAVAVVALAVLGPFKAELMAAFQAGINALRAARGG